MKKDSRGLNIDHKMSGPSPSRSLKYFDDKNQRSYIKLLALELFYMAVSYT
jgi:hypothetical protein